MGVFSQESSLAMGTSVMGTSVMAGTPPQVVVFSNVEYCEHSHLTAHPERGYRKSTITQVGTVYSTVYSCWQNV